MGVDVLEVDVLGVDFKALIPWENGSEQDEERMSSVIHPLTFIFNGSCLMLWKNIMERLA